MASGFGYDRLMLKKLMIGSSAMVATVTSLYADGYGVKAGNPILPGVPYEVHDGTRPQPPIVANAGAVVVQPPADAVVLFDGKNLDAWESPAWQVKDGVMIAAERDIVTKQSFGAIQLHVEWRCPAGRKVDGQSGGNSGIFLMGLYEIQVLQSHNNKTYPDGQATALYGQVPPLVNATTAQGEWQSYDIIFTPPVYEGEVVKTPAHATVIHNGVVTQNHSVYLGTSTHKRLAAYPKTHPEKAPIRLQFHGDPMEFRNFWVRPLGKIDEGKP